MASHGAGSLKLTSRIVISEHPKTLIIHRVGRNVQIKPKPILDKGRDGRKESSIDRVRTRMIDSEIIDFPVITSISPLDIWGRDMNRAGAFNQWVYIFPSS